METMEIAQRRAPDEGDASAVEESSEEEEKDKSEATKVLKILAKARGRPKVEIPLYDRNLNVEKSMNWISSLDKYFDYEEVDGKKKVKFTVTRLKGHATISWDELQTSRARKGKPKIKQWDKMVSRLKAKFMPKDYQLNLFRQLQNLRQKGMTVKEYTKEFYKLSIRARHVEDDVEKLAKYINGLRYNIQDEIILPSLKTIEDAYQAALKAKEKMLRKQSQRNRGKSSARGRGTTKSRFQHLHGEAGGSSSRPPQRGDFSRGRFAPRGRGRGRGIQCYTCGEWRHGSWHCPHNKAANQ